MLKTPNELADELMQTYKNLYNDLPMSSDMERSACILYISIFEKLKRKMRLSDIKVIKFIREDFEVQDKKRLQFGEDSQTDDAYLCAQTQEAYRLFWTKVLGLSLYI